MYTSIPKFSIVHRIPETSLQNKFYGQRSDERNQNESKSNICPNDTYKYLQAQAQAVAGSTDLNEWKLCSPTNPAPVSLCSFDRLGKFCAFYTAFERLDLWDVRATPILMTSIPLPQFILKDSLNSKANLRHCQQLLWSYDAQYIAALFGAPKSISKRSKNDSVKLWYFLVWEVKSLILIRQYIIPFKISTLQALPCSQTRENQEYEISNSADKGGVLFLLVNEDTSVTFELDAITGLLREIVMKHSQELEVLKEDVDISVKNTVDKVIHDILDTVHDSVYREYYKYNSLENTSSQITIKVNPQAIKLEEINQLVLGGTAIGQQRLEHEAANFALRLGKDSDSTFITTAAAVNYGVETSSSSTFAERRSAIILSLHSKGCNFLAEFIYEGHYDQNLIVKHFIKLPFTKSSINGIFVGKSKLILHSSADNLIATVEENGQGGLSLISLVKDKKDFDMNIIGYGVISIPDVNNQKEVEITTLGVREFLSEPDLENSLLTMKLENSTICDTENQPNNNKFVSIMPLPKTQFVKIFISPIQIDNNSVFIGIDRFGNTMYHSNIHRRVKTDFPGPMYPIGFQLIPKVISYHEAEDELDYTSNQNRKSIGDKLIFCDIEGLQEVNDELDLAMPFKYDNRYLDKLPLHEKVFTCFKIADKSIKQLYFGGNACSPSTAKKRKKDYSPVKNSAGNNFNNYTEESFEIEKNELSGNFTEFFPVPKKILTGDYFAKLRREESLSTTTLNILSDSNFIYQKLLKLQDEAIENALHIEEQNDNQRKKKEARIIFKQERIAEERESKLMLHEEREMRYIILKDGLIAEERETKLMVQEEKEMKDIDLLLLRMRQLKETERRREIREVQGLQEHDKRVVLPMTSFNI